MEHIPGRIYYYRSLVISSPRPFLGSLNSFSKGSCHLFVSVYTKYEILNNNKNNDSRSSSFFFSFFFQPFFYVFCYKCIRIVVDAGSNNDDDDDDHTKEITIINKQSNPRKQCYN